MSSKTPLTSQAYIDCCKIDKLTDKTKAVCRSKPFREMYAHAEGLELLIDSTVNFIESIKPLPNIDISTCNAIKAHIHAMMSMNLKDKIGNSVNDSVGNSVWDSVQNPVDDSVRNLVDDSVHNSDRTSIHRSINKYEFKR